MMMCLVIEIQTCLNWCGKMHSKYYQVIHAQSLSCGRRFTTLWTVACQAPLSMGFPRQEYQSGLPFPPPGDLPDLGIELTSLAFPVFFDNCTTWERLSKTQVEKKNKKVMLGVCPSTKHVCECVCVCVCVHLHYKISKPSVKLLGQKISVCRTMGHSLLPFFYRHAFSESFYRKHVLSFQR